MNVDTFPLAAIVTLLVPFCTKPLLTVVIFPVVKIAVAAPILPKLALPVVEIVFEPAAIVPMRLPAVILPVPVISPAPNPKLPTLALPVVVIVFVQ